MLLRSARMRKFSQNNSGKRTRWSKSCYSFSKGVQSKTKNVGIRRLKKENPCPPLKYVAKRLHFSPISQHFYDMSTLRPSRYYNVIFLASICSQFHYKVCTTHSFRTILILQSGWIDTAKNDVRSFGIKPCPWASAWLEWRQRRRQWTERRQRRPKWHD